MYKHIKAYCVMIKCRRNPCQNNATCVNFIRTKSNTTYQCNCTWGYKGKNCELTIDYCESEPCQYDSPCNSHFGYYTCDCVNGTLGHDCKINVNNCTNNEQCGNGICVYIINGDKCKFNTG